MRAPRGRRGLRVPRALGPLAALPVAGVAAAVCAFAVLAPPPDDDERGPRHETRLAAAPRASTPRASTPRASTPRASTPRAPARATTSSVDPETPAPATRAAPTDRDAILAAALSSDEAARADAISGLRVLAPDPIALDALARLVEDPAPFVSAEAAMALASFPDGRGRIVSRLRGNEDPGLLHVVCIEALRDHGAPDDVPTLERFAATEGPVGDAAAAAVRAICARAGVESPLPEPEPLGEPRPDRE